MKKFLLLTVLAFGIPSAVYAQNLSVVDSLIAHMSVREKVAQLFVISLSSDPSPRTKARQDSLIKSGVGSIILMRGYASEFMERVNELQGYAKLPLLVSIDGEWGAAMRFKEYLEYPRQYELGHLENAERLLYRMGINVGKELKDLNVMVNLAPCADVSVDGVSCGIRNDSRLFSSNPEKVARYSAAYARGMRDAGIYVCAKHFPGCGNGVDSHYDLPVSNISREALDSIDLLPYKRLFEEGIEFVMMHHVSVPCIDDSGLPLSISHKGVTGLLKEELGFEGLVMTDAIRMGAISKSYTAVESNIMAYKAGIDMILMPDDIPATIQTLTELLESGELPMEELDTKVRKILTLKEKAGYFAPGFNRRVTDVDKKIKAARKRDARLIRRMTEKLVKCGYGEPIKDWNDPTLVLDNAGK